MSKKINLKFVILLLALMFILVLPLSSCCSIQDIIKTAVGSSKTSSNTAAETSEASQASSGSTDVSGSKEDTSNEENAVQDTSNSEGGNGNQAEISSGNYKIVYFEVASSQESNHFEHRVASIYSIKIDGSEKETVYTDLKDKNDFGPVFDISPDGKKIACMINDGARGVYSALCVLDINSGELKKLVEFDFSDEPYEVTLALYGKPVWSSDSSLLAYELISNPYTSNFRDRGIFTANVETGEIKEVVLDVGGASLRSTMFMAPVFFFDYDDKIAAAFHPYHAVEENNEVIDYYSINEGINTLSTEGGPVNHLFDITAFQEGGPEIIRSMDNFKYLQDMDKTVFQVLGDFEEDGDLWISGIHNSEMQKVTDDPQLREQQPDIFTGDGDNPLIAYAGVKRYGTISNQIPSGDIYIINADGTGNKKLTNYSVGPSKPVISPDGAYVAYLNSIYDENFEYITNKKIETVKVDDSGINVVVTENGYIELVGWIIK
jgi:Tol biopolymer transport system component